MVHSASNQSAFCRVPFLLFFWLLFAKTVSFLPIGRKTRSTRPHLCFFVILLIIPHAHAKQRARAHGTFYYTLFVWRGVYRSDCRANYVRTDHRFLSRQRTDKKTIAAQGVVRSTNTIPIYSISFFCSLFKWQTNFFIKNMNYF
jgi:hypothetical protein